MTLKEKVNLKGLENIPAVLCLCNTHLVSVVGKGKWVEKSYSAGLGCPNLAHST